MAKKLKVDVAPNQFRFRLFSPKKCSPKSFRIKTLKRPKGVQLVICCEKGKFSRGRCRVGTGAQSVRVPRTGRHARTLVEARKIARKFTG